MSPYLVSEFKIKYSLNKSFNSDFSVIESIMAFKFKSNFDHTINSKKVQIHCTKIYKMYVRVLEYRPTVTSCWAAAAPLATSLIPWLVQYNCTYFPLIVWGKCTVKTVRLFSKALNSLFFIALELTSFSK